MRVAEPPAPGFSSGEDRGLPAVVVYASREGSSAGEKSGAAVAVLLPLQACKVTQTFALSRILTALIRTTGAYWKIRFWHWNETEE